MVSQDTRSRSLAVALMFAAGSLLTALLSPAPAIGETIGQAEAGRTFVMPLGNHTANGAQSVVRVPAPSVDAGSGQPPAILQECATSSLASDSPANAHGAVSALRLVAVTISEVGVYNRTDCAIISRVRVANFFAGGFPDAAVQSFFSTRVIYDFTSHRFLVSARSFAGSDQFQYFAVSTSDTGAAWRFFRIKIINPSGTNRCVPTNAASWSDVSPGVNNSRWLITGLSTAGTILSLEKQPTLGATGSPKFKCFNGLPLFMQPPIVRGISSQAYFLTIGNQGGNAINRVRLDVAPAVAQDSVAGPDSIGIPAWTIPPNAPQPNGQELDTFDGSFRSASIQIGAFLWNVHTVDVNGQARWRLYKLSTTGPNTLFVFTPDTIAGINHDFNASVATGSASKTAPAFVTFSRTRPSSATGRVEMVIAKGPNSSAAGWTFTSIQRSATQFEFAVGTTPCNSFFGNACRWGEYSATQVDPTNSNKAWGFNQLVNGNLQTQWTTRAGQID